MFNKIIIRSYGTGGKYLFIIFLIFCRKYLFFWDIGYLLHHLVIIRKWKLYRIITTDLCSKEYHHSYNESFYLYFYFKIITIKMTNQYFWVKFLIKLNKNKIQYFRYTLVRSVQTFYKNMYILLCECKWCLKTFLI